MGKAMGAEGIGNFSTFYQFLCESITAIEKSSL